ncbi:MAG: nucleotide exchange factor GrpE [gamma proteobacterium symbiont of Phacoides pectinatus]
MEKDQEAVEQETAAETIESESAAGTTPQDAEATAAGGGEQDLGLLLEDARSRADEHWDQLMRARAELDNLRKRQERELENAHKYALERFVNDLLPVRDSMELGVGAAREENGDVGKLLEGAELTLKLFTDVMQKYNVEQIDPEGEPFNPEFHQAMSLQPRDDLPPNTVVTVVQKGYSLNGRLVRPAMVLVSRAAEQ